MTVIKLCHDFSGDHWINKLTKDEAYDIADKIEKYIREHDKLDVSFSAKACEMTNSWSVYLRYRFNSVGVFSYADLYVKMRAYDSMLKRILTEAGVDLKEES
jgi:hypothetical protein